MRFHLLIARAFLWVMDPALAKRQKAALSEANIADAVAKEIRKINVRTILQLRGERP